MHWSKMGTHMLFALLSGHEEEVADLLPVRDGTGGAS